MREQVEVAQRRKELAHTVCVLGRAMQQLQQLPEELAAKGQAARASLPALGDVARDAWDQAEGAEGGVSPRHNRRGQSRVSEAALAAAKGLQMYQGLNISMALPSKSITAGALAAAAAPMESASASALDLEASFAGQGGAGDTETLA
jgi:hypothetical protein